VAFEEVANLDELEVDETLLVELNEPVCVLRLGERDVRAIHNTCSHQQQPLHEGPSMTTPSPALGTTGVTGAVACDGRRGRNRRRLAGGRARCGARS
jgi:nitrite reductase/ring-hydroxylating ferredoxin subunit